MKYICLDPKYHRLSNTVLKGWEGVSDLTCVRYDTEQGDKCIASYFRLTFWQRIRFLFCGRIFLHILGTSQPPIALGIGEFFDKNFRIGAPVWVPTADTREGNRVCTAAFFMTQPKPKPVPFPKPFPDGPVPLRNPQSENSVASSREENEAENNP